MHIISIIHESFINARINIIRRTEIEKYISKFSSYQQYNRDQQDFHEAKL